MVAVTPDESIALVAVITTLEAGLFPNGIAINARGTKALVANRADSTVSVYVLSGTRVELAGQVRLQSSSRSKCSSSAARRREGATL